MFAVSQRQILKIYKNPNRLYFPYLLWQQSRLVQHQRCSSSPLELKSVFPRSEANSCSVSLERDIFFHNDWLIKCKINCVSNKGGSSQKKKKGQVSYFYFRPVMMKNDTFQMSHCVISQLSAKANLNSKRLPYKFHLLSLLVFVLAV